MALLTTAQVREHVETDLGDDALGRVVDAADAEIIRRLGALASATAVLPGGGRFLLLPRKASAIGSVTERYAAVGTAPANYALVASDYNLYSDGLRLERLVNGANPSSAWNGAVTVVFTPADTEAERIMLLINLVKLEVAYLGRSSEGVGDMRADSFADHAEAKAALFRPLTGVSRLLL